MVNITANSTDALFGYTGSWSRGETTNLTYRIWNGEDSLQLRLDASEVYLFGNAKFDSETGSDSTYSINVTSAGSPFPSEGCSGTIKTNDKNKRQLCMIKNPSASQLVDLKLSIESGQLLNSFSLKNIAWNDPNESNETGSNWELVQASNSPNNWETNTQGEEFRCSPGNGSNITFEFSGSGVIVKGLGNKSNINAAYKVSVNGNASAAPGTSDLWEAYAPANQVITLYRNMRLGNESQSITLSDIQLAPDSSFCVLRANVSSVNRHEDTPSSPSPTADDSHNSVSKSLSSGKKVGIAVGVIIIVGIIVGGIILFYRRRIAHRATTWDPKKVKYCSKCGTAITDRYRMECVQAGSCVQDVDLHLKCQDWNEPKNHSHEVHKVLNRQ